MIFIKSSAAVRGWMTGASLDFPACFTKKHSLASLFRKGLDQLIIFGNSDYMRIKLLLVNGLSMAFHVLLETFQSFADGFHTGCIRQADIAFSILTAPGIKATAFFSSKNPAKGKRTISLLESWQNISTVWLDNLITQLVICSIM